MKSMVNPTQMLARLVFVLLTTLCVTLSSCDKGDDPKPTPPVIPTVSITTATALPSTTAFGGKSKITIVAQNVTSIDIMEGDKVIKTGNGQIEFETDPLFKTTKYTVVAKNNNQSKTAELTIIVGEIDPELKLITDGHWQIIKNEEKEVWKNETEFTEKPVNPTAADNTYSFPNPITCVVDWGTLRNNSDEKNGQTIHFEGYNPKTKEIFWIATNVSFVTTITTKILVIDREIYTFAGTEKTILRETYKNVK